MVDVRRNRTELRAAIQTARQVLSDQLGRNIFCDHKAECKARDAKVAALVKQIAALRAELGEGPLVVADMNDYKQHRNNRDEHRTNSRT